MFELLHRCSGESNLAALHALQVSVLWMGWAALARHPVSSRRPTLVLGRTSAISCTQSYITVVAAHKEFQTIMLCVNHVIETANLYLTFDLVQQHVLKIYGC